MKKWKLKNCTAKIMKTVLICGDEYIHICKDMEDTMNKIKCFLNKRKLISKNTREPRPGIQNERSWRTLITWRPLSRRAIKSYG